MSSLKKNPTLDMEICYSGFKVEELEYIGYSRSTEDQEDDFLDTFNGKLDDGGATSDEEDSAMPECSSTTTSFSMEECQYRSYLCSTPTGDRREEEFIELNEIDYLRSYRMNDSGMQTQSVSAANSVASFFEDENNAAAVGIGSLESLSESVRQPGIRRRIELNSEINDPYSSGADELELSIEEDHASTTRLGSLKRRLSLKTKRLRKNMSTGIFGTYLQRTPPALAPPPPRQSQSTIMRADQAPLLNGGNKPTGPVNLWFRKFRNRHFI